MNIKTLEDLYLRELDRTYTAEKHIIEHLPLFNRTTAGGEHQSLASYASQTRERRDRLERIFEHANRKPAGVPCRAIEGIFLDARESIDAASESGAGISAPLELIQVLQHDMLGRYTTLASWATKLCRSDEAKALLTARNDALMSLNQGNPVGPADKPESRSIGMGDRLTALLDRKK
jgi:ferritin-like metal-binding protein YciE